MANGDAQGTVLVTDLAGNRCTVPVIFRFLPQGTVDNRTLCSGEGLLFAVSGTSTRDDSAACSASQPGFVDLSAYPPGYEPSVEGSTRMVLKKDGVFDARLRLLYSESLDGGVTFPDFQDVTETVDPILSIDPDPTRVVGTVQWTPVRVTCAIQSEPARLDFCAALSGSPGPDFDGDGYPLCGSTNAAADCNDQRGFINPGATERCNGLDDDCDGSIDEGNPTAGTGVACSIPGLLGVCAIGETSCADGPLVCRQTVFPAEEVACNGLDDDCDGRLDEAYVFGGYLAPIKSDGSTVFLKKRGSIPVKFQWNCAGALITNAVARIAVRFLHSGTIGSELLEVSSVGDANTGDLYRYDPVSNQYIYNLNASSLSSNSVYEIETILDDGTEPKKVSISIK